MRPLVAHCHLGLGRLGRRTADWANADEHRTSAATMPREMEMCFWPPLYTILRQLGVSLEEFDRLR